MGYITILGEAKESFTEKKSEFIASLRHVETSEEAMAFINEIVASNRKARDNVYAYVLRDGNIVRYSDDGEPQGTAGVPVLEVLKGEKLTDVCVVVTRYFGGILLGTGGLARAYSHACKLACTSATKMLMEKAVTVDISCEYSLYGKISYVLPTYEVKTLLSEFGDDVKLKLLVKSEIVQDFCDKAVDLTNGRISLCKSDVFYADFS